MARLAAHETCPPCTSSCHQALVCESLEAGPKSRLPREEATSHPAALGDFLTLPAPANQLEKCRFMLEGLYDGADKGDEDRVCTLDGEAVSQEDSTVSHSLPSTLHGHHLKGHSRYRQQGQETGTCLCHWTWRAQSRGVASPDLCEKARDQRVADDPGG